MTEIPVVFISSTCEDLARYRTMASDAANSAGFKPDMKEFWPAKDNTPLEECLAHVAKVDVLVVIVAHKFGWVPRDQPGKNRKKHKSITWLECEKAKKDGKDVLVFLVDEKHSWPAELYDRHQLTEAAEDSERIQQLAVEIPWRIKRLKEFKEWLSEIGTRATFTTPESLDAEVGRALQQWRSDHHMVEGPPPRVSDPDRYLRVLHGENSHIDIRGFQVASGRAQRFPIDDLYISLKTVLADEPEASRRGRKASKKAQPHMEERSPVELEDALKRRRLVILGDPGAGQDHLLATDRLRPVQQQAGPQCRDDG